MPKSKGKRYGKKVKKLRKKGYSKQGSKFWASSLTGFTPRGTQKGKR